MPFAFAKCSAALLRCSAVGRRDADETMWLLPLLYRLGLHLPPFSQEALTSAFVNEYPASCVRRRDLGWTLHLAKSGTGLSRLGRQRTTRCRCMGTVQDANEDKMQDARDGRETTKMKQKHKNKAPITQSLSHLLKVGLTQIANYETRNAKRETRNVKRETRNTNHKVMFS